MPPLLSQWNKEHLSLVLRKWVISALKLDNYNDQNNLFIQIKRQEGKGKDPSTTVFLRPEGLDEVQTFFLSSPSPTVNRNRAPEEAPAVLTEGEAGSPVSILSDDFMTQIDSCANEASMAEFPTVFYTPGVGASSSPRATVDETLNEPSESAGYL